MLQPFTEDVEEQLFPFLLGDTTEITGKGGTYLKIPPGAFLNKSGQPAQGQAVVHLKEYYEPGDIILSGMHTLSGQGLLQTGGMVKVLVIQNGDTFQHRVIRPVTIRMPDRTGNNETMIVFTSAGHSDSSLWEDTRQAFDRMSSVWNWPSQTGKLQSFYMAKEWPFHRWANGTNWTDEYRLYNTPLPFIIVGREAHSYKGFAWKWHISKFARYTVTKTDSATLKIDLHQQFRHRGRKRYGQPVFDTTFYVKQSPPFFSAQVQQLNLINCDRFLGVKSPVEFYVKTPGFSNARLLVYFKKIKAFLPGYYKGGQYIIDHVPPFEQVTIYVLGQNAQGYYLGESDLKIIGGKTETVNLKRMTPAEIKERLKLVKGEALLPVTAGSF